MTIIEHLTIEHVMFYEHLDALAEAARCGASAEVLRGMVRQLSVSLERHAGCEDAGLLPALAAELGREGSPVAVMEAEHQQIRALMASIEESPSVRVPFLAADLAELVSGHMRKEDCILFRVAARLLEPETLEALTPALPAPEPTTGCESLHWHRCPLQMEPVGSSQ